MATASIRARRDPLGDRGLGRLDLDRDQARLADRLELPRRRRWPPGSGRRRRADRPHEVPVHRPFGQDQHARRAPSRRAASHASDRNGSGAVALDTTTRRHGVRPRSWIGSSGVASGESRPRITRARRSADSGECRGTLAAGLIGPRSELTRHSSLGSSRHARATRAIRHPARLLLRLFLLGLRGLGALPSWARRAWPLPSSARLGLGRLGLGLGFGVAAGPLALRTSSMCVAQDGRALVVPRLEPGAGVDDPDVVWRS